MVAFISSGISRGLYPLWHELVADLCDECGVAYRKLTEETSGKLLTEKAELAFKKEPEIFEQVFLSKFDNDDFHKIIYQYIAKIPFLSYVTLNFDRSLHNQLQASGKGEVSTIPYPILSTRKLSGVNLHHIHGFFDPDSVFNLEDYVFTKNSFSESYKNRDSSMVDFWRVLTSEFPVLFVSCGLRESEIQNVLKACNKKRIFLKGRGLSVPPLYILREARYLDENTRDMVAENREDDDLSLLGLTVVRYDKINHKHKGLTDVFAEIAGVQKPLLLQPNEELWK